MTSTQLERDFSITEPVALAIAESITRSKVLRGKSVPTVVDLAGMITGVGEALTMQGAPQLQINLEDEGFALLESGFWGASPKHGRLDEIELNHPAGSKYWWRLRQVSPKADFSVQTYWIPRVVRELMDLEGPLKASRASRTRARFLKMLCDHVPDIKFHSKQIAAKQPIAPVKISSSGSSGAKSVGLSSKSTKGLTVKGSAMTTAQRDVAGTLLQVCDRANAGAAATEGVIYAAIYESGFDPHANNGSFWGVLSGAVSTWQQTDTVGMAEAFLHGGKGFQSGGAIALSHTVSNPVEIAVRVEAPSVWPNNAYAAQSGYPGDAKALAEVKAIIQAGGGATGTGGLESGTETVQQYNFEVGTTNEPHEDYWTAMNRLAQEVNWELVVDGPDIYYDSDVTLCRMTVADVIERTDDNVIDWSYDWDDRQIVTNLVLVIACDEFAYKPADAVEVKGFGPASEGSTIGLPGRWLVGEAQRNPGDIVATLTLVQPTRPLKEPAPTVSSSNSSGVGGSAIVGAALGSALAAFNASNTLSQMQLPYLWGGGHGTGGLDKVQKGGPGLDCSGSTCWVLKQAGMYSSSAAIVSGDLEQFGEAGQGKEMTVWARADHVFIEFNVPGHGRAQMNTNGPQNGPRLYTLSQAPTYDMNPAAEGFTARHAKGT